MQHSVVHRRAAEYGPRDLRATRAILTAYLVLVCGAAGARESYSRFGDRDLNCQAFTPADLHNLPQDWISSAIIGCLGVIQGVWHSAIKLGAVCPPSGIYTYHATLVVLRFIDASPRSTEEVALVTLAALKSEWPCR